MSLLTDPASTPPTFSLGKVRWSTDLTQFFPLSVNGWKLETGLHGKFLEAFGDHPKDPSYRDVPSLLADYLDEKLDLAPDVSNHLGCLRHEWKDRLNQACDPETTFHILMVEFLQSFGVPPGTWMPPGTFQTNEAYCDKLSELMIDFHQEHDFTDQELLGTHLADAILGYWGHPPPGPPPSSLSDLLASDVSAYLRSLRREWEDKLDQAPYPAATLHVLMGNFPTAFGAPPRFFSELFPPGECKSVGDNFQELLVQEKLKELLHDFQQEHGQQLIEAHLVDIVLKHWGHPPRSPPPSLVHSLAPHRSRLRRISPRGTEAKHPVSLGTPLSPLSSLQVRPLLQHLPLIINATLLCKIFIMHRINLCYNFRKI